MSENANVHFLGTNAAHISLYVCRINAMFQPLVTTSSSQFQMLLRVPLNLSGIKRRQLALQQSY